jgi:protein-arginine kinase activator protein McsA
MVEQLPCSPECVRSWVGKASETETAAARKLELNLCEKAMESWKGGKRFLCAHCLQTDEDHKEAILSHVKEWYAAHFTIVLFQKC